MKSQIRINNISIIIPAIERVSHGKVNRPSEETFKVEVFTDRGHFIEEFKDEASALVFKTEILDSIDFFYGHGEIPSGDFANVLCQSKDFQSILNLMNTAIAKGRSLNPTEMSLALIKYNDSDQII